MATYPIKMLKDEMGQNFVPYTHVRAVSGGMFVTSTLNATQDATGKFTITHEDLVENDLKGKIVGVCFPSTVTATSTYTLRFKTGSYYTIYAEDGTSALDISKCKNMICFLKRNESTWQLVRTGAASIAGSGHYILNSSNVEMTQRSHLKFTGMNVTDSSTATIVSPILVNNLTTSTAGSGALDASQGKVLNDKFSNYLLKSGGTLTGTLTGTTINATTFVGALSGKATSAGSADNATTADKVKFSLTLKQNKSDYVFNGETARTLYIPTVHSGASVPSSSTGQDGDIYILLG